MGLLEAKSAMSELETAKSFDYDKVELYKSCLQRYIAEKSSSFPKSPALIDLTSGRIVLPEEIAIRIEDWMANHPEYSPFVRTFARYYLAGLLDNDHNVSMYRHIAECIVEGGDFYIESGMFYLRDAAAVPTYTE